MTSGSRKWGVQRSDDMRITVEQWRTKMNGRMTITEFLLARISEDEAAARLPRGRHWSTDSCYEIEDENGKCVLEVGHDGQYDFEGNVIEHFARHDPARVLAECAVKRAIIELHLPTVRTVEWFDDATGTGHAPTCPSCRPEDPTDWNPPIGMAGIRPEGFVASYTLAPCPTLRALAAVYREHPEYDPEWA